MKKLLILVALAALALFWWIYQRKSAPKETPFTKVVRETIVSAVTTNGKVEPAESVTVAAERAGVVARVRVERGARVRQGDVLVELESGAARAELAAAEARAVQARAELAAIQAGGRASDLAAIEGELAQARIELAAAVREREAAARLLERQAATKQEAEDAARRAAAAEALVKSLENRRRALASAADREAAKARLKEAEAGVEAARLAVEKALIRAPMAGVVYDAPLKEGVYLNPGDVVARIGRIERVRVRVYVDEPELGRVRAGLPVLITWDALAGRRWEGKVEKLPSEISTLGTRQVGEVVCLIENPGGELLPGANVNAEIRSEVTQNALSIPREALRREGNEEGVLLLQGDRVVWRMVKTGISSVTRVQVLDGLSEGDAVALPGQHVPVSGERVRPVWR